MFGMLIYLTEPVLVVVRLAPNGCLLNHLRNHENPYINVRGKQKHLTHMDQLRIARDIANGMSHLSNKKVKPYAQIKQYI